MLGRLIGQLTRDFVEAGDSLLTAVVNIPSDIADGYEEGLISGPTAEERQAAEVKKARSAAARKSAKTHASKTKTTTK